MPNDPGHHQRFVVEAKEHLAAMTSELIALERGEGVPQSHFEQLLRSAHSIKGGAGFTGHVKIEKLAHALEAALENLREGHVMPGADAIDTLLSTLDRINAMVDNLDHSEEAETSDCLERLRLLIDSQASPNTPGESVNERTIGEGRSERPLVRSTAQPGEFPINERILATWQRAGFLYGVKLDWFQCERENGLAPLEVAQRLEQAGTVLDSRIDLVGPPLDEGLPVGPMWYRAIISSSLGPEQFSQRLGIPSAAIARLQRVDSAPGQSDRPAAQPVSRAAAGPASASPASSSLRIPVSLIDRMMGLAGELVLVRNQALQSFVRAGVCDPGQRGVQQTGNAGLVSGFTEAGSGAMVYLRQLMRRLDSVTSELQDAALRMRMQPVGTLFDRFPRLVRDVARQLGKQIEIEISGNEVELDKTIIEMLSDPLTHLVRNCCDHGIESPDEREQTGKPACGRIALCASQQRGRILIQIRDDGRGLDREAIRKKALERGVRRAEELAQFTDRQIFDLILMSGFSTAARVTDLSGRGVGMDVVKTNLEQIGGVLEIDSAAGQGTSFTLSLPLTLAIVPCLLLHNSGQRYVLPLRDVEEIVFLESGAGRAHIESSHDGEVLRLRGRLLPVTRLDEMLGRSPASREETRSAGHSRADGKGGYVAVVKVGSQRFGLVVENLLGSEDVVVKPLHPLLRPLALYSGATILGDGDVALILSVDGLARESQVTQRQIKHQAPALTADRDAAESQTLLVFRYGPAELLALNMSSVRRVVTIQRERIERVGDRELINIDGAALNVIRLDQFLNLSPCPDQDTMFLILPRRGSVSAGFLASQIVDTPTLPLRLDTHAYQADGVLGSSLICDQIAVFLDVDRILEMWSQTAGVPRPALPGGTRKRILVVDDTQFFRQLIKTHLENAGHEVVVAINGSDALHRLAETSFDLIVSDIEMPVMDGFSLARRLREEPRFSALPMLAVTTLSAQENRERALACGFDAYEIKLDRGRFLSCVTALLQTGRAAEIVPASAPAPASPKRGVSARE